MSAVCVLSPIVIASWPAISAAIAGAAAAMGFSAQGMVSEESSTQNRGKVETEIEDSEVVADGMGPQEKIVVQRDDITIEFGRDERGRCTVCVSGERHSDAALRKIGESVAGRVVQQFTYNKLISELKKRHYTVSDEQILRDDSVRIHVRL